MVLTMEHDGTLTPGRAQQVFSQTYLDGIAQTAPAAGLVLFGQVRGPGDPPDGRGAAPLPRAPAPELLAAIEDTALRYAGHRGLRTAGLSVTDWLTLYRANIEVESAYDRGAVSQMGAIGLGQLMPATARSLGVDPHDWRDNLDGSARYLAMMLDEFGDARMALAAYNAGPGAVRTHAGIPPFRETRTHVERVLAVFNRLEGASR